MAIEELIIPEDFTLRFRFKKTGGDEIVIEEDGLSLKFDITLFMRNAPPNDARWSYMASYLTQRWTDKLEGKTISPATALDVWRKCLSNTEDLKKNSDSTKNSSEQSPA